MRIDEPCKESHGVFSPDAFLQSVEFRPKILSVILDRVSSDTDDLGVFDWNDLVFKFNGICV